MKRPKFFKNCIATEEEEEEEEECYSFVHVRRYITVHAK
jgi:hypothetical protein